MTAETLLFVGTLTRDVPSFDPARGRGIITLVLDSRSGGLSRITETAGIDNPTYLALDSANHFLYATSEVYEWHEGTVTGYRVDLASGLLTYINKQPTLGHLSAHVSLVPSGRYLVVANYSAQKPDVAPGRSVTVLPVHNGWICPPSHSLVRHGSGPLASQERAHAHCTTTRGDGLLALADLGTDEVIFHRLDADSGRLSEPIQALKLPPGSGPRHVVFSDCGRRLYVINEWSSTIALVNWDEALGRFKHTQTVSTTPDGFSGANRSAAIALSPDGRWLFGTNRGHDSVVVFRIDPEFGQLSPVGYHTTGGRTPRSCAIDPTGQFLLIGNQDGHSIKVFRIDEHAGTLIDSGTQFAIASPMCITFLASA